MKTLVSSVFWFLVAGAAFFIAAQFLGTSPRAAGVIYAISPALGWLAGLWISVLAVITLYGVFAGTAGKKIVSLLTGIQTGAPGGDPNVNALVRSFLSIMSILLLVSLSAFVRINVYTGYECENASTGAYCEAAPGTKRVLFLPGVTLPGAKLASRTLPDSGGRVYFVANTPPVGGAPAAWIAFLTLLFIGIARVSLMLSRRKS